VLVVLPVYNEEMVLRKNARLVLSAVRRLPESYAPKLQIVCNGCTDQTEAIARELCVQNPEIDVLCLPKKGRGHALRTAWLLSEHEIMCYLDIDLSASPGQLRQLLDGVHSGHDLCVGSRNVSGARAQRAISRRLLSLLYHKLVRFMFRSEVNDFQCGLKAISSRVRPLVAQTTDSQWFFDAELLLFAERNGLAIREIPVAWRENPRSKVRVVRDVLSISLAIARFAVSHRQRPIT